MFVIPEREALTLTNDRPAYATTQKAAKGGQQLLNSLLPLGEGGRRPDEGADVVCSYTSKVSEVSRVSEMSKMSKQGEQQSLHSLRPLTLPSTNNPVDCLYERKPKSLISRRWSDKSALTYGEKMQCNSYEILKQVQDDGKSLVKDAQSQCTPCKS